MHKVLQAALLVLCASRAEAQPLAISGADCRKLARHVPDAGVEYRPGVDARGKAVAPADLNATPQIHVPDTISFDAAVDLRRFGVPAGSPLFQPNAQVGEIRIGRDGQVLFNGEPLGSPEIRALEAYCSRQVLRRR